MLQMTYSWIYMKSRLKQLLRDFMPWFSFVVYRKSQIRLDYWLASHIGPINEIKSLSCMLSLSCRAIYFSCFPYVPRGVHQDHWYCTSIEQVIPTWSKDILASLPYEGMAFHVTSSLTSVSTCIMRSLFTCDYTRL